MCAECGLRLLFDPSFELKGSVTTDNHSCYRLIPTPLIYEGRPTTQTLYVKKMKTILLILTISLLTSTSYAVSFYSGEWKSTDKSCVESKGHLNLSITKNNKISMAMFCYLDKNKNQCSVSKSKNTRLSMAYGKINKNNEIVIAKHEGYIPAGIVSPKIASGTFSSATGCKGNWTAIH